MKTDVICIGQALIDCITGGMEKETGRERVYRARETGLAVGGDAAHQAFRLAGKGYAVKLVCGIGNDPAGSLLLSEIRRRGIGTAGITVSDKISTPVANLMVDLDGSRISVNSPAAMLEGYEPSVEAICSARVVSFASLFRAPLDRADTVKKLIRTAHDAGSIVCCDTKLPTFREIGPADLREVLPFIDYIFPNETEAAFYTGEKGLPEMAAGLREMGVRNVIIKAGADGCYADLEDGCYCLPAVPARVIDTTGAGDAFVTGFIAGILEGVSHRECLESALKEAAGCVGRMGGC